MSNGTGPEKWNLEEALGFIRGLQQGVMKNGYYIALGGGVLNTGQGNDLDLVLVPRRSNSDPVAMAKLLDQMFSIRSFQSVAGGVWMALGETEFVYRTLGGMSNSVRTRSLEMVIITSESANLINILQRYQAEIKKQKDEQD